MITYSSLSHLMHFPLLTFLAGKEDCDQNKKNEGAGDLEGAENLEGDGPLHKGGSDVDKISTWAATVLPYWCPAEAAVLYCCTPYSLERRVKDLKVLRIDFRKKEVFLAHSKREEKKINILSQWVRTHGGRLFLRSTSY